MDAEDFQLLRTTLTSLAERHRVVNVSELTPDVRKVSQHAFDELGLGQMRATSPAEATVQECAILADDMGGHLPGASFLGPTLLAPELLRLTGQEQSATTATIALGRDLALTVAPGEQPLIWDADGADVALIVRPDASVVRTAIGDAVPTADLVRSVRSVSGWTEESVGTLDAASLRHWRAYVLTMVSSEMLGGARSLLADAIEYAKDRVQYGQVIGTFQAVQHLLADAHVLVETSTSVVRYAAWSLDNEQVSTALRAAFVAKAYTNDAAVEAIRLSMQVFGGIAQTWEHPAHLYLRRALVLAASVGRTSELQVALATWEDEV